MKIILFNGPPGSGKDEASKCLEPEFTSYKFAGFLKDQVHHMLGLESDYDFEGRKDLAEHGGVSLREAYIQLSEHFFKPLFGEDFFGAMVAQEIEADGVELVTISDSGFVDEAEVLVDKYGKDNIILVHLRRDYCAFAGDSRDYIHLDGVKTIDVSNNGTLEEFHLKIRDIAQ